MYSLLFICPHLRFACSGPSVIALGCQVRVRVGVGVGLRLRLRLRIGVIAGQLWHGAIRC